MRIYMVDAFTDVPFKGNPAAVCLVEKPLPDERMQQIAMEMNQAETAFLTEREDGYSLRWFTPQTEVDLCGHATLASAHLLWEQGFCSAPEIAFHTISGVLTARKEGGRIQMNFPAEAPIAVEAPDALLRGLGINAVWVGKNRLDYMIEAADEQTVRALEPDLPLLRQLGGRGVIVTSRSERAEVDFVSRCFFPAVGIDEDPVTGSAHCCTGPYWMDKLGKDSLTAIQLSARQGDLGLKREGDRIIISGRAVTTLKGELTI